MNENSDQAMEQGDPSSDALLLSPRKGTQSRVADRLYRRLRRAIISGEILPRSRLVETELAEALNVSRTPLREAISRLAGDHLVRPLAYGGVEVVDTQSEMDEIYFIREALEGCAARLAAERITDAQVAELDRLVSETERAEPGDFSLRTRINGQFHDLITQASGSERLVQMVESFREFFMSEAKLASYSQKDSEKAIAQHRELVDAFRDRDGKRAERLIRRHLEMDRRRALKKGKP